MQEKRSNAKVWLAILVGLLALVSVAYAAWGP